jgi:hypothetical protein
MAKPEDPASGIVKTLVIDYQVDDKHLSVSANRGRNGCRTANRVRRGDSRSAVGDCGGKTTGWRNPACLGRLACKPSGKLESHNSGAKTRAASAKEREVNCKPPGLWNQTCAKTYIQQRRESCFGRCRQCGIILIGADRTPGLVNQLGRLKRVTGSLSSHLVRRQLAQLLINQRQQLPRSVGVTAVNRAEQSRNFVHKNLSEQAMLFSNPTHA